MPGFGFGGGASPRAVGGAGGPLAATAPIPDNYDMIFFGDSRTEDGIGASSSQTNGYSAACRNLGAPAWVGPLSGNRLRVGRFANFGVSASDTAESSAVPRQDANGVVQEGRWDRPGGSVLYTSNKGADYAASHDAGIVCMLMGVNDGFAVATTVANIESALDTIGTGKVVLLCNELSVGVKWDGVATANAGAATRLHDIALELNKLDYASGDAKARPNVIVIDTNSAFVDPASGSAYTAKAGLLRDGLHLTPLGGRVWAQTIIDRLAAIWPHWSSLPSQAVLPTANGLSALADAAPFINSNPILTPGGNGTIVGTWATAPLASGVPQGWLLAGSSVSAISCVATKDELDDEGYPCIKLVISGTLPANSGGTVQISQSLTGTPRANAITAGLFSIEDKLRAVGKIKVEPGSVRLMGAALTLYLQESTVARTQQLGTFGGNAAAGDGEFMAMSTPYGEAAGAGEWLTVLSEMLDQQQPEMVAGAGGITATGTATVRFDIGFRNNQATEQPVSATVRISRLGIYRTAS